MVKLFKKALVATLSVMAVNAINSIFAPKGEEDFDEEFDSEEEVIDVE